MKMAKSLFCITKPAIGIIIITAGSDLVVLAMQNNQTIMTPFNNPLIRFVSDRKYRWLRHTLFILGGLILAYKGDIAVPNDPRSPEFVRAVIIYDTVTFTVIMGMLYFMILVLIPRLLFRSKVFLFSLSFFVMLILIYLLVWYIDDRFIKPLDNSNINIQHIELSVMHFIQISAVSSVLLGSVVGLTIFKKNGSTIYNE